MTFPARSMNASQPRARNCSRNQAARSCSMKVGAGTRQHWSCRSLIHCFSRVKNCKASRTPGRSASSLTLIPAALEAPILSASVAGAAPEADYPAKVVFTAALRRCRGESRYGGPKPTTKECYIVTRFSFCCKRLSARRALVLALLLGSAATQAFAGAVTDVPNDFLPSFIGPHNGDLDVLSAQVTFDGVNFTFT